MATKYVKTLVAGVAPDGTTFDRGEVLRDDLAERFPDFVAQLVGTGGAELDTNYALKPSTVNYDVIQAKAAIVRDRNAVAGAGGN